MQDLVARSRQVADSLAGMLVAKSVAVEMYLRDALTVSELELVHACRRSNAAAHILLEILTQQSTDDASLFACFLECLKITQQQHVYAWITRPGM